MYWLKHIRLQHKIDNFNKSPAHSYRYHVHKIENASDLYITLEIVDYETNNIQRETHTIHEWLYPLFFESFVNRNMQIMRSIKE